MLKNKVGKLLIAHPNLPVQNPFHKSVIYIFNDGPQEGTQGLILNKSTPLSVNQVMNKLGYEFSLTKEHVRFGGPVNSNTLFMLHSDDFESASSAPAGKGLMVSCDDFMFQKMVMGYQPSVWRLMVGISSWAPGQLDAEIKGKAPYKPENSWLTATPNDVTIFEYDGERQWQKALELSSRQMINHYL